MAVAQVEDGKIVTSGTQSSIKEAAKKGSTLDKDAFLGLLVAQMRYQDPLEPTSNTEFISQYAQFSSLEQMQNMSATLELSRASSLVGKIVTVKTVDSLGKEVTLQGKVDFVTYENNKAYVSVGDVRYPLDDVLAVADQEYLDALDMGYEFAYAMGKLPNYEDLSLDDKEDLDKLNEIYDGMSSYEKTFISKELADRLEKYTKRVQELVDDLIGDFTSAMDELPAVDKLTADHKETIDGLNAKYNNMSDYEKKFVDEDYIKKLEEYTKKIAELTGEGGDGADEA